MARSSVNSEQKVLDLLEGMTIEKAETVINMLNTRLKHRKEIATAGVNLPTRKPKVTRKPRAKKSTLGSGAGTGSGSSISAPATAPGTRARFGAGAGSSAHTI